jgi:hypothetical protein
MSVGLAASSASSAQSTYEGACCDTNLGAYVGPDGNPANVDIPEYRCAANKIFLPRPTGFDPTKSYTQALVQGEASGDRFCPRLRYCCPFFVGANSQVRKGRAIPYDLKSGQKCQPHADGGFSVTFLTRRGIDQFCTTAPSPL